MKQGGKGGGGGRIGEGRGGEIDQKRMGGIKTPLTKTQNQISQTIHLNKKNSSVKIQPRSDKLEIGLCTKKLEPFTTPHIWNLDSLGYLPDIETRSQTELN
jgi:hypothetical protein